MSRSPFLLFLCICLINLGCSQSDEAPIVQEEPDDPAAPAWTLIWEEEFDEDLSDWNIWEGGAFNNELQHYQGNNLEVREGLLHIHQRRESVTGLEHPFTTNTKDFDFTSGRIESKTTYGPEDVDGFRELKYLARIKLAPGEGLWPAFWSYNDPWPTAGELDVMEFRGSEPTRYQTNFHFGTTTGQLSSNPVQNEGAFESDLDLTEDYHIFEVEWTRDTFVMRFDSLEVRTYEESTTPFISDIFGKKHRIVLNMAVGGDFFNGKGLVESNIPDESTLLIDWVRVYAR